MIRLCVGIVDFPLWMPTLLAVPCAVPNAVRTSGYAGIAGFICPGLGGIVRNLTPSRPRRRIGGIFAIGFLSMAGFVERRRVKRELKRRRIPQNPLLTVFLVINDHG
jgi:hypothetical protein